MTNVQETSRKAFHEDVEPTIVGRQKDVYDAIFYLGRASNSEISNSPQFFMIMVKVK